MAKLPDTAYGYVLNVARRDGAPNDYGAAVAETVLDALAALGVTGEIEYYAGDGFLIGQPDNYLVGLAVDLGGSRTPSYAEFSALRDHVRTGLTKVKGLSLFESGCEMGTIGSFAETIDTRGRVRFAAGRPAAVTEEQDSLFMGVVHDRLGRV